MDEDTQDEADELVNEAVDAMATLARDHGYGVDDLRALADDAYENGTA